MSGFSSKVSGLPSRVGLGGMPRPGYSTPGSRKQRPPAEAKTSAIGPVPKVWLPEHTAPPVTVTRMPS